MVGIRFENFAYSNEVEVSFLYPHGPNKSFSYPDQSDILVISAEGILTKVHPVMASIHFHRLKRQLQTRTLEERVC